MNIKTVFCKFFCKLACIMCLFTVLGMNMSAAGQNRGLLSLDFDSGVSEVNITNRLLLFADKIK